MRNIFVLHKRFKEVEIHVCMSLTIDCQLTKIEEPYHKSNSGKDLEN